MAPNGAEKGKSKGTAKFTMGFPLIENLIETENFDDLNKSFLDAYSKLEGISKNDKNATRRKQAKKAMKCYEKTMDLLRELLGVKEQMIKQLQEQQKKDKK